MELYTKPQFEQLLANGRAAAMAQIENFAKLPNGGGYQGATGPYRPFTH